MRPPGRQAKESPRRDPVPHRRPAHTPRGRHRAPQKPSPRSSGWSSAAASSGSGSSRTVTARSLVKPSRRTLTRDSILITDDWGSYKPLRRHYIDHQVINHSAGVYVEGSRPHQHDRGRVREHEDWDARRLQEGVRAYLQQRPLLRVCMAAQRRNGQARRCSRSYSTAPPKTGPPSSKQIRGAPRASRSRLPEARLSVRLVLGRGA